MTIHMTEEQFSGKKKRSKYNNVKVTVDGIKFDSKAEAKRYGTLKGLQDNAYIRQLELQPTYSFDLNGVHICKYKADFRYKYIGGDDFVVEDVKGVKTAVYKLKKKLMKAFHNIDVQEIT